MITHRISNPGPPPELEVEHKCEECGSNEEPEVKTAWGGNVRWTVCKECGHEGEPWSPEIEDESDY